MLRYAAGLLFLLIFLQGCGTKGPLYLPAPDKNPAPADQKRK